MTTIINPSSNDTESSGVAFIMGILAVVVLGTLLVFYALPAMRADSVPVPAKNPTVEVVLPAIPSAPAAPAPTPAPSE